jgi:hypothetical protein
MMPGHHLWYKNLTQNIKYARNNFSARAVHKKQFVHDLQKFESYFFAGINRHLIILEKIIFLLHKNLPLTLCITVLVSEWYELLKVSDVFLENLHIFMTAQKADFYLKNFIQPEFSRLLRLSYSDG